PRRAGHDGTRHRGDPARQHQSVRRVRRDAPHAGHVYPRAGPMTATSAASAAYIVAGLLFVLALAGLSKHETAKAGNGYGIAGMTIALAATIGLATRSITAIGLTLLVVPMLIGASIG